MKNTSGYCARCGVEHTLPADAAIPHARALLARMEATGRIDWDADSPSSALSTDMLWGEHRGMMFGVLLARDGAGDEVVLRAFSGAYGGVWRVPGWVEPIVDGAAFAELTDPVDRRIRRITEVLTFLEQADPRAKALRAERAELSRMLTRQTHELYVLANFRGQRTPLPQVFAAPPTGTGECCAPKLLQHAATHGLTPLALAEFYYGAPRKGAPRKGDGGMREHGHFYPACAAKCRPILGYMLCGYMLCGLDDPA